MSPLSKKDFDVHNSSYLLSMHSVHFCLLYSKYIDTGLNNILGFIGEWYDFVYLLL